MIPPGYPQHCSDEQLLETISRLTSVLLTSGNTNSVLHYSPFIALGQNELQRRQVEKMAKLGETNLQTINLLHQETQNLRAITDNAASSSNKTAKTSLRLTNINVGLTVLMFFLSLISIFLAWKQTQIAEYQNRLYENEVLARPKLDVKFVNGRKLDTHTYLYELRVENLGNNFSDGAYLHIWTPQSLSAGFEGISGSTPDPLPDGFLIHHEVHIMEKILIGRNIRLGSVTFKFDGTVQNAEVKYQIAAPKMRDINGTFNLHDEDYKEPVKTPEKTAQKS